VTMGNPKSDKDILKTMLKASAELMDTELGVINYQTFTDTIVDISGASYASFNVFEDNGQEFRTVSLSGAGGNLAKATKLLGFDLQGKKWDYDPVREDKIKDSLITEFETLHQLTGNVIPEAISKMVEKSFKVGRLYVVRIVRGEKAFGDFTLIFSEGKQLENPEIVQIFANLSGLLVSRVKAENEAELKIAEVQKINTLMIDRELQMVNLKNEIKKLKENRA
jgi:hypothetical protein